MIALLDTLPPPALDEQAVADWRAIQLSESGHAIQCEVDAARCIGWSRDCDEAGDHQSAGYWIGLAWVARERAAAHVQAARLAHAEITAIRMRCSPSERALLFRRAASRGAR